MSFPPRFLDELRDRTRLADVIGRKVQLQRRGREQIGLCPFHKEKTPSFTVNDEKGFYHCFGCGQHGDAISFVMETETLTFPEAVEQLAAHAGMEVPRASPEETQREIKRGELLETVEAATVWFEDRLHGPEGKTALDYFTRRGLSPETIAKFRLGYAPALARGEPSRLATDLLQQDFKIETLIDAGLLNIPEDGRAPYDFFRGRAMFPISNRRGQIIAFGGRVLGKGEPKYLNSRDTPLFDKRRTLYNLANAREVRQETTDLIVAEGYMDVIALDRSGFPAAVAPLGTALTEEQIEALWRLVDEPVLCFDGDDAGRRAARRGADRALPMLKPGKSLRFAFLPQGEDPDSLLSNKGAAALRTLLDDARPLVEVIWEMENDASPTDTPERIAGLKARLRQKAATIGDPIVREQYRNLFDERTSPSFRQTGGRSLRRGRYQFFETRPRTNLAGIKRNTLPQKFLLATLLNHPSLIDEFGEVVIEIALDPNLDKLRQELHRIFAANPDLDAEGLHSHLIGSGFADILSHVLHRSVLETCSFARSDTPLETAREGVSQVLNKIQHEQQIKDHRAFSQEAAKDGSEESYVRFLQRGQIVREAAEVEDGAG
ncbi:MAG: DNA primase [Alphaproteobacteria bacterium MarineAlpha4_Bin2]|nr:MAG: DNA primase [Alphaproteobacteria bacterium MarineAlpha4_Bin2]